jgi:hypothetical protein
VYESSITVERFWVALCKKDFYIQELISMGVIIVDDYMEIKSLYDKIISAEPEFKEVYKTYI